MSLRSSFGIPSGPGLLLLGREAIREEKVAGQVMRGSMDGGGWGLDGCVLRR